MANEGLTRKPRKGEIIRWPDWPVGKHAVVTATPEGDDDICWIIIRMIGPAESKPTSFIWRHPDGLNKQATIIEDQRRFDANGRYMGSVEEEEAHHAR